MPKFTRIYTRAGDSGTTGLVGGARVKKNELRIDTYGTVDELLSAIGLARAAIAGEHHAGDRARAIDAWLAWTQDVLFDLGTELATPQDRRWENMPRIGAAAIEALERGIDESQRDLPPLNNFIHPGGTLAGGFLHFSRTVCRRAERLAVSLHERDAAVSENVLAYLNRLSDALFVWARAINHEAGHAEHVWRKESTPPG